MKIVIKLYPSIEEKITKNCDMFATSSIIAQCCGVSYLFQPPLFSFQPISQILAVDVFLSFSNTFETLTVSH